MYFAESIPPDRTDLSFPNFPPIPLTPSNETNSSMDLTMLELLNSAERDLDDWAALFSQADVRFQFLGGQQPAGSHLWIMQARWDGGGGRTGLKDESKETEKLSTLE